MLTTWTQISGKCYWTFFVGYTTFISYEKIEFELYLYFFKIETFIRKVQTPFAIGCQEQPPAADFGMEIPFWKMTFN